MSGSKPLRRTRGDLIATALIAVASLAAIGTIVAQADITRASLTHAPGASTSADPIDAVPRQLHEDWRASGAAFDGATKPVVVSGLTLIPLEHGVRAVDPEGAEAWRYERSNRELCQVMGAWDKAVAVFRGPAGCGEVVTLNGADGEYRGTRSAAAPEEVLPISSNSRVGTLNEKRLELWREDMVRTVEYGEVEAKQEPDLQPHEGCRITSALTRTTLLANTEVCPEEPHTTWLRLQQATPEESRKPEVQSSVALAEGARVIAISQEAAAVYEPTNPPRLRSFSRADGRELAAKEVPAAPVIADTASDAPAAWVSQTADLPHAISWFDGRRLYLLGPTDLRVMVTFEDAIGTGVAIGTQFAYPTAEGIAVADPATGKKEFSVPIDRGGVAGPVGLGVSGNRIVEKRGGEIVGLGPS